MSEHNPETCRICIKRKEGTNQPESKHTQEPDAWKEKYRDDFRVWWLRQGFLLGRLRTEVGATEFADTVTGKMFCAYAYGRKHSEGQLSAAQAELAAVKAERDKLIDAAKLGACKSELTTLLKISACPAESHEPEEGDTETIKRFRQICLWMNKLDKELTETKAELARYQWQPIENVPTDAVVILCDEDGNRWSDTYDIDSNWNLAGCGKPPTHWMPLPPSPTKSQPSDKRQLRNTLTAIGVRPIS